MRYVKQFVLNGEQDYKDLSDTMRELYDELTVPEVYNYGHSPEACFDGDCSDYGDTIPKITQEIINQFKNGQLTYLSVWQQLPNGSSKNNISISIPGGYIPDNY